jgi:hypothetical protein
MDVMLIGFGMDGFGTAPKDVLMYKGVRSVATFNLPVIPSNHLLSVKITVVLWVALMASMGRRGHCTSPEPLKMIYEHNQFANTLTIQEWAEDESINESSLPLIQHSRRLTQACPSLGVLFHSAAPTSFD